MSIRTITINWIERKIVFVLSKENDLDDAGLAGLVLKDYQNEIENGNFDLAIEMLMTRRVLDRIWGEDGVKKYCLKRAG